MIRWANCITPLLPSQEKHLAHGRGRIYSSPVGRGRRKCVVYDKVGNGKWEEEAVVYRGWVRIIHTYIGTPEEHAKEGLDQSLYLTF